jgi:hypothetical protein|tara:strand:+ start:1032 stop:1577 length:546 start_codon:yes stop_codon:yes gene_type:complete
MKFNKLIMLAFMPGFSSASLITFDSIRENTSSPYIENGYKFELVSGGTNPYFGVLASSTGSLYWQDNGIPTGSNPENAMVKMTRVDGGLFDLWGFDLIGASNDIWLNASTGGVNTYQVSIANGNYTIPINRIDSAKFDFRYIGPNSGAIDNVNVSAVTEPSSLALLGLGIAGLSLSRRKKT